MPAKCGTGNPVLIAASSSKSESSAPEMPSIEQALRDAKDIIVPGYGMVLSKAQQAVKKLTDALEAGGARALCHPPGGGAHAGSHERAADGGGRALRNAV